MRGAWTLLLPLLVIGGCATNPATKEHDFVLMSERDELELGRRAAAAVAKQMRMLPASDPLVRYVDAIGQRLAKVSDRPDLIYRFHVVDDGTINAFALPGGWIYVHRGLLAHLNSEAELAAVLGHEIGHVTARHAVKQYTKAQTYQLGLFVSALLIPGVAQVAQTGITDLLALAVIRGYGRAAELEADRLAMRYAARAGYDPYATLRVLDTLERIEQIDTLEKREAGEKVQRYHGLFSTHPETEDRIRQLAATLAGQHPQAHRVGRADYLRRIDGIAYGESAEQGAIVRGVFIHPRLGFRVAFPEGWFVRNTPQAVVARARKQKAFARIEVRSLLKRQTPEEALRALLPRKEPVVLVQDEPRGPFRHAAGRYRRISMPRVSRAEVEAHLFLRDDKMFLLVLWCPLDEADRWRSAFARIARSFDAYDPARDGTIPVVALDHWRAGDSWRKRAEESGMLLGPFTAERLAALNGMGVDDAPPEGTPIKIVR